MDDYDGLLGLPKQEDLPDQLALLRKKAQLFRARGNEDVAQAMEQAVLEAERRNQRWPSPSR
jgi:hypothetical protein